MKNMSIVGEDYHTDEHVVGYYNAGDRVKYRGRMGAFWGGIWGWLFRRFDLPEAINVDKVSAALDKGILQIVAAKAQAAPKGRTIPVAAQASAAG